MAIVQKHLESFRDFPQRQHPAGFNAADAAKKALETMGKPTLSPLLSRVVIDRELKRRSDRFVR
jgi:hypothetical protein